MSKESFGKRSWSGVATEKERPGDVKAAAPHLHDRSYKAFDLRDGAERLQILRSTGPSRFPAYSYLLDISYENRFQSAFTLVYTFMLVEVTGTDLWPIVHALNFGQCECIREYHRELYDPAEVGQPLIQKIVITAVDELRSAEKVKK